MKMLEVIIIKYALIVEKGCFNRGGRIKYFMFYDFFALIISIGLFFVVYIIQLDPAFNNSGDFV